MGSGPWESRNSWLDDGFCRLTVYGLWWCSRRRELFEFVEVRNCIKQWHGKMECLLMVRYESWGFDSLGLFNGGKWFCTVWTLVLAIILSILYLSTYSLHVCWEPFWSSKAIVFDEWNMIWKNGWKESRLRKHIFETMKEGIEYMLGKMGERKY